MGSLKKLVLVFSIEVCRRLKILGLVWLDKFPFIRLTTLGRHLAYCEIIWVCLDHVNILLCVKYGCFKGACFILYSQ